MRKKTRGKKFDPVNEQRIRTLLAAGRMIAAELERNRAVFNSGKLSERDLDTVKLRLLNCADRLSNMLTITMSHIQRTFIPEDTYWKLMEEFDFLRGYIDRLGTGLMLERVKALGERASRILDAVEYPLFCVFPIRHELVDLLATISNITKGEPLPESEQKTVAGAVELFNELVEIEMGLAIPHFDPPGRFDPLKPISTEDLLLYANAA